METGFWSVKRFASFVLGLATIGGTIFGAFEVFGDDILNKHVPKVDSVGESEARPGQEVDIFGSNLDLVSEVRLTKGQVYVVARYRQINKTQLIVEIPDGVSPERYTILFWTPKGQTVSTGQQIRILPTDNPPVDPTPSSTLIFVSDPPTPTPTATLPPPTAATPTATLPPPTPTSTPEPTPTSTPTPMPPPTEEPCFCPSPEPTPTPPPAIMSEAELETLVSEFWLGAIIAEVAAFNADDISYLYPFLQGEALSYKQSHFDDLRNQGLIYEPAFDFDNSYWADIRQINENMIEVDTCEYWSGTYYNRTDGAYIYEDPYQLLPQTITIEWLGEDWFITRIEFYPPSLSCE